MNFTHTELLELEKFFSEITIPKVVQINQAITQTDAPKFVKENVELLKSKQMTPSVANGRYRNLVELKRAILDPVKNK